MYDVIVIGGGPAGITAAVTAINRRLETLIIAERWGGQTAYFMELEDADTHQVITGEELLSRFRRQLDYLDFCRHFDRVVQVSPVEDHFSVVTVDNDRFEARSLIIATGAKPQRMGVPGEDRLVGHGLSYSVVAHGALFLGKDVAVVGTYRRAQLAVCELAQHAHQVYLFAPELLPSDQPLVPVLRRLPNVSIYEGATIREVKGERFVEGIVVETVDGAVLEVPVKGVFVKLPRKPNSELVRDWVDCDEEGRIKINLYGATSYPGVFAAGDVTHISEQVLVHIGEGAKAAVEAYAYLLELKSRGQSGASSG
ncbi:MAG: NAD(P)/FAD-dependent oxidoreductase [Anaerolineales bacterium]|nr:NAD(P)/FAD-dependent oxidoreductase [Anaerolineales bacterium]